MNRSGSTHGRLMAPMMVVWASALLPSNASVFMFPVAGPSEVVVIADETAPASFIASDLLAQAEHSEDASAILITTSHELGLEVLSQLATQMCRLSRVAIIEKSLAHFGAIIVADNMEE